MEKVLTLTEISRALRKHHLTVRKLLRDENIGKFSNDLKTWTCTESEFVRLKEKIAAPKVVAEPRSTTIELLIDFLQTDPSLKVRKDFFRVDPAEEALLFVQGLSEETETARKSIISELGWKVSNLHFGGGKTDILRK